MPKRLLLSSIAAAVLMASGLSAVAFANILPKSSNADLQVDALSSNSLLEASSGQSATGTITLKNITATPITGLSAQSSAIDDGAITLTNSTCTNNTVPANGSCQYSIAFAAKTLDAAHKQVFAQKETVTFSYGANGKTATSLPYSFTVTNAAPDYFIDYPLQLKPSAQGIGSNLDKALFQDPTTGTILLGTDSGLSISTDHGKTFVNRTTANGLAGSDITNVAMLANGVMIAGANNHGISISTDGGYTFQNYSTSQGLVANRVSTVTVHGNTVYIGTPHGLSVATIDPSKPVAFTNFHTSDGLASDNITSLAVAQDGKIFVETDGGLSESTDGKTYKTINKDMKSAYFMSVHGSTDSVYAVVGKEVDVIANPNVSPTQMSTLHTDKIFNIYGLVVDDNNDIFINGIQGIEESTDGKTFHYNQPTTVTPSSKQSVINLLSLDGPMTYDATTKTLDVATENNGFYTTPDAGKTINMTLTNNIGGKSIYEFGINLGLTTDSSGDMFVPTQGGVSVSRDGGQTFTTYTPFNGTSDLYSTGPVYVDSSNHWYFVEPGLIDITNDQGTNFHAGGIGTTVRTATTNSIGVIFAGNTQGLYESIDGGSNYQAISQVTGSVNSVVSDLSKHAIYVGTQNDGFFVSFDEGTTFKQYASTLPTQSFNQVLVAKDGSVYLASDDGLFKATFDESSAHKLTFTRVNSLHAESVYIDPANANAIYVGTNQGVSRSTDGGKTFQSADANSNLNSRTVNGMALVNGKLFVTAKSGGFYAGTFTPASSK